MNRALSIGAGLIFFVGLFIVTPTEARGENSVGSHRPITDYQGRAIAYEACIDQYCVRLPRNVVGPADAISIASTARATAKIEEQTRAINAQNAILREQNETLKRLITQIETVQEQRLSSIERSLLSRVDAAASSWKLSDADKVDIKEMIIEELQSNE